MNRTLKYALSAALSALMVVPALAQDNFPDVPESHWAYKELARMKAEGLLVGYPDGLFRGGRPASRYELAVAVYAAWSNLKGITDGLKSQIDDLTNRMANAPTKADLDNLRAAIDALTAELNKMKDDIAALRRMMDEFRAELTRMGADVDQVKKDMDAMRGDVAWLKQHALPFDVSGDVNLWMGGGYGDSGRTGNFGITVDGRPTGVRRGAFLGGPNAGPTQDLTILHEGALKLVSNNTSNVQWKATMVYGNMLGIGQPFSGGFGGGPFIDQSRVYPGVPFGEGFETFYFQDFSVNFDTSVAGLGFNAELGRIGVKVSPYIFQRPDNTPYYSNSRWDNGLWNFDGGNLGFKFGGAKLNVFGGRTSGQTTAGLGILPVQSMYAGAAGSPFGTNGNRPRGYNRNQGTDPFGGSASQTGLLRIDQTMGAALSVPLSNTGSLSLAYLWLSSNDTVAAGALGATRDANGVAVYGGDLKFNFSNLDVSAGYSKSDVMGGNHAVINKNNAAWYGQLGYAANNWGIKGGYRRIEPQFGAPGDWGRIGIWWNPTDIKGFYADAHFDLSKEFRLMANAGFYTGTGTSATAFGGGGVGSAGAGLSTDDHLNHFNVGLGYKMGANHSLLLGYEGVFWDLQSATFGGAPGAHVKPRETWWNIGWGLDLNARTNFNVLWQISDYDSKGATGFEPFAGSGATRARGGLITSQLTVRF